MKKLCVIALIISLLFSCLTVFSQADSGGALRFTNYPQESLAITLSGGALTVSELPDSAAYRSVMIVVLNDSGREQFAKELSRRADGTVSTSLRSLRDGGYYIELYFYVGGNKYASYVFGDDLHFRMQGGEAAFVEPPTLELNRNTFEKGRTDDTALCYYLGSTSRIQSAAPEIIELAAEITDGLVSDYDKALAIHDWICTNLWYDSDSLESGKRLPGDALSSLNNLRAVCEGYATLNAALLRASGIPAKYVLGCGLSADESGGWTQRRLSGAADHAWNEAYIDDRWVIIDTTWNCANEYSGGRKVSSGGIYTHRYFDATIEAFSIDHRIDDYEEGDIPPPDAPSSWAFSQVDAAISAGLVPRILRTSYSREMTRAEFCLLAVMLYENMTGDAIAGRQRFYDTDDVNVEKAAAIGIVNGVGGNMFAPDSTLTREQAAAMLARLAEVMGKPLEAYEPAYADNDKISLWALDAVGQLQAAGIMGGVGDNTFSPVGEYTREQSIVTVFRLFSLFNAQT